MRTARIFQQKRLAGLLEELDDKTYRFTYTDGYAGEPISFTMPIARKVYEFAKFPSVFEGLLPEGVMLEALLRNNKIDRNDFFRQLITVGEDVVGSLTIELGS